MVAIRLDWSNHRPRLDAPQGLELAEDVDAHLDAHRDPDYECQQRGCYHQFHGGRQADPKIIHYGALGAEGIAQVALEGADDVTDELDGQGIV